MRCLGIFLCALLVGAGCASEANKAQWDEVWKDLRGDNMQMRNNFADTTALDDHPIRPRSSE